MPVFDARSGGLPAEIPRADVCIVGAGAAGLYLASRLVRRGLSVILAEAGGRVCASGESFDIGTTAEGSYRGTTEGRAFGLGGSTALWGGQLIPHTELDLRAGPSRSFDFWSHLVGQVREHATTVAGHLELVPEPDWALGNRLVPEAVGALETRGLRTLTSDWLPFRKRNMVYLLKSLAETEEKRLSIFLNAPAADWELEPAPGEQARVLGLKAANGERTLFLKAREFVIAAGTVETTRILLEMERMAPQGFFRKGTALGRYLADHLSCHVGNVPPEDVPGCIRLFGARFRAGRMKTFRFVETSPPPGKPRAFFHFIFDIENPGFLLAKKLLISLQSRAVPRVGPGELAGGVAGLSALAWNRFLRNRLYVPRNAPTHLQLDIEQSPHAANRVELGPGRDSVGRPEARVRWQVHDDDYRTITETASRVVGLWPGPEAGLPRLQLSVSDASAPKPHDVYHPVGSCRMGEDEEAVVDPSLRVWGTRNLHVLSTAVFPSAGTANPTFSMLCLGHTLAGRLASGH